MVTGISGANSSLYIGAETTYGTTASGITAIFGHGLKLDSIERNNNIEKAYGLGSRLQTSSIEKQFSGSLSTSFLMSNPGFLYAMQGNNTDGGANPYTHTMLDTATTGMPSYTIQSSLNLTTPIKVLYKGCVNTSTQMTASVNEAVSIKMDWVYANEVLSNEAYIAQTAETEFPFAFQHGVLEFPASTTLANVQSFDLSVAQNEDIILGLGSRTGTARVSKQKEYALSSKILLVDPANFWKVFYNGTTGTTPGAVAETATLQLTFTNGAQVIVFDFTGLKIETHSSSIDTTAVVYEDVKIVARGLTITSTNTQSSLGDWTL